MLKYSHYFYIHYPDTSRKTYSLALMTSAALSSERESPSTTNRRRFQMKGFCVLIKYDCHNFPLSLHPVFLQTHYGTGSV